MSRSRSMFYKNNPNAATSWRQKNLSYPEKLFQQLVEKNELTKQYDIVREYSFFPYFIDFAFVNIKLAVEIDGSQHWKKQSCVERDQKKDEQLLQNGWKIYRIPEFMIKAEFAGVEYDFLVYLANFEIQPKRIEFTQAIIEHKKYKQLKEQDRQRRRESDKERRQQLKQQWLAKRLKDVKRIGQKWGRISELSCMWNVSHTQVRRFLETYAANPKV